MLCRSACFKRWIYVCPVVCFFVLFTCFHPLLFDMSNCRGKTYCKSFTVLWGFRALGDGSLQRACLPDLLSEWFVSRRVATMRCAISDWLSREIDLLYHPTPLPFLVPTVPYPREVCVNKMSVWAKIPIPRFTLNLPFITQPPPLIPSPLQSASQSRCSSPVHLQQGAGSHFQPRSCVCWTSSCSIRYHHTRCTYRPSHHHQKMSLDEGNVAERAGNNVALVWKDESEEGKCWVEGRGCVELWCLSPWQFFGV